MTPAAPIEIQRSPEAEQAANVRAIERRARKREEIQYVAGKIVQVLADLRQLYLCIESTPHRTIIVRAATRLKALQSRKADDWEDVA